MNNMFNKNGFMNNHTAKIVPPAGAKVTITNNDGGRVTTDSIRENMQNMHNPKPQTTSMNNNPNLDLQRKFEQMRNIGRH